MDNFWDVNNVEVSEENTVFSSVENYSNVMNTVFWSIFVNEVVSGFTGKSILDNAKDLWEEFKK